MNILFPFHTSGFDLLQENEKKEVEMAREEMLLATLCPENSDKSRFADLNMRVENNYVLNKAEHPSTVTAVQSLLLNHQPSYNSKINSQYNRVSNQLVFAQCGKTGGDEGEKKEKEKRPGRNLDHIACKYCGEKDYYAGNSYCSNHTNLKSDVEALRKMKQGKYANNPSGGGD